MLTRSFSPAAETVSGLGAPARPLTVNDVHSQLNRTEVAGILQPSTVPQLQAAVRRARGLGLPLSIAGGRHSMGGQQFCRGGLLLDTARLTRILELDENRGLVTVEAGLQWPELIAHLAWAAADQPGRWSIIQKQTGADRMTIGGSLAANIHGRGLRFRPIVSDVEAFTIVNAEGSLVRCSRSENADLFAHAIGGYGLFGAMATVTLRLTPRHKVERRVSIALVDDVPELFARRIDAGYEYGDLQFATDPRSEEFLQAGVFSCYRPVPDTTTLPGDGYRLTAKDWRRLLLLAHTDKARAFAEYARYYMSTDGQIYWSDTHQLASYENGYHEVLDSHGPATFRGSEMISELYVPRHELPRFMRAVRTDARQFGFDIIYGTIRLIERDDESALPWAREPWACIVFNLHVDHTAAGLSAAADHFRRLIDRALERGGSYYLTYHRWATRDQVAAAHPRLAKFLARKRDYDGEGVFQSDWYRHHSNLLEALS